MLVLLLGCQIVLRRILSWFTDREKDKDETLENANRSSLQLCSFNQSQIDSVKPSDDPSHPGVSLYNHNTPLDETDGFQGIALKRKHLPDEQKDAKNEDEGTDEDIVIDEVVIPAKSLKLSASVENFVKEKEFDVSQVHGYDKLPFLSDADTVDFIKKSHTLFIMRGLPGSGKSYMVKCIQEVYKDEAVVCSADHFFMNKDGTYKFIKSKLPDAHKHCQGKATYHCEKGTKVIIIDNTNIQRWEMSHYIRLAQSQQYYHVVIVEPQSPWRYNPIELAKKNSHDVELDLIEAKLRALQNNELRPMYYGWFLNRDDSAMLVHKAREVLEQCEEEMSVSDEWLEISGNPYILDEISKNIDVSYTDPLPMLHCTAAYLARRTKDLYHTCENVTEAIGRKFSLCISGFVYSKRAISARVDLRSKGQSWSDAKSNSADTRDENNCLLHLFVKEEEERLQEKYRDTYTEDNKNKHVVFQHGTSAHITLCYSKDGQSKHSGEDILNICELEFYGNAQSHVTKAGKLSVYGNDIFQVELNSQIDVTSLFHGFYSSRG